MQTDLLKRLLQARDQRRAVAVVSRLDGGRQWLVEHDDQAPAELAAVAAEEIFARLISNRSGRLSCDSQLFVQVLNPPLKLYVVGAVHIAQSLLPIAIQIGYDVTVIDPRQAWASPERFPQGVLLQQWPDEAMATLSLDSRSALVLLSHDPKIDDPALHCALRSELFYIGALGSRKTHAARCQRLSEGGFSEAEIARIHAPIGLDLGGRSPAEIALSVMAQITQVLHRKAQ